MSGIEDSVRPNKKWMIDLDSMEDTKSFDSSIESDLMGCHFKTQGL